MHLGLQGDYQNVHPHVRCEVEHSIWNSTIAGAYYNSESKVVLMLDRGSEGLK